MTPQEFRNFYHTKRSETNKQITAISEKLQEEFVQAIFDLCTENRWSIDNKFGIFLVDKSGNKVNCPEFLSMQTWFHHKFHQMLILDELIYD